jgi:hypothetical protein
LFGEFAPLPFVHCGAAQDQVMRTAKYGAAITGFIDVQDVHANEKGG